MIDRKYYIADFDDAKNFNFQNLVDFDIESSRKSLDLSKVLIRIQGEDIPSFLNGLIQYEHNEIIEILKGEEWSNSIEI